MPELENVDESLIKRAERSAISTIENSNSNIEQPKKRRVHIEEVNDDSSNESSLVQSGTIESSLVVNQSDDNIVESIESASVERDGERRGEHESESKTEEDHADSMSFDSVSFTNLEELD